ncbi:glutathione S-transferase F11 [Prunus yedoensis var. nudiflora]|uniref:glutathione transferase n=1 Tax=Prunus yedoensis var. nudiflora TaxID=2094558 RepID=A0A314UUI5_PRUYE|nr:glutathione S-transferase F11 [Prunus yedoensis var. nudiflora]
MVVKVYGPVKAACPQRVMVCLLEKGVNFEIVDVNLEVGEQKRPQFLSRQPFGQVPVVEDGDFRLFAKLGHLVTERKNVNAWWKDISNRPAWKKLVSLASDY